MRYQFRKDFVIPEEGRPDIKYPWWTPKMEALVGTTFEITQNVMERDWVVVTDGHPWTLHKEWIEPVSKTINYDSLGDL